jgi:hypothetical protein
MTAEQIFMAVLSIACGGIGWFCRQLWDGLQRLSHDLQALEVRISSDYVRYDRMQDAMRPIMTKLEQISSALEHKADKP